MYMYNLWKKSNSWKWYKIHCDEQQFQVHLLNTDSEENKISFHVVCVYGSLKTKLISNPKPWKCPVTAAYRNVHLITGM